MPRFAFKITEEVIEMASQMTGTDAAFPDDLYIVVDMLSPTEFHATLMTTEQVVEEYKKDTNLLVV